MDSEDIRGMKFPLEVNPATGRFALCSGRENVKESVYLILMTQCTERFTRPEFGSRIMTYAFMDPSPTRLHMAEREIKEALMSQEPRIEDAVVTIRQEKRGERLIVQLDYSTAGDGKKGRLELYVPE